MKDFSYTGMCSTSVGPLYPLHRGVNREHCTENPESFNDPAHIRVFTEIVEILRAQKKPHRFRVGQGKGTVLLLFADDDRCCASYDAVEGDEVFAYEDRWHAYCFLSCDKASARSS